MPASSCSTSTDVNTFFTIDDIAKGAAFDVVANVEIGQDLNQNVDTFDLRVGSASLSAGRGAGRGQTGHISRP